MYVQGCPGPLYQEFDAAIIDLDGTLVDTLGDFSAALNLMLVDLSLAPVAAADVARWVGKGSEHLIRSTLSEALDRATAEPARLATREVESIYPQAWQRYQHHYQANNGKNSAVYPGVLQGLEWLREQGWELACLTNKPLAFARKLLKLKQLDAYFVQVFGGDSFERKKPDPLPLLKTCEALGSEPLRTLMIGDSSNDAKAARAAGCPVVLVTYGYNHGEPIHAVDADGFLDSLDELATLQIKRGLSPYKLP